MTYQAYAWMNKTTCVKAGYNVCVQLVHLNIDCMKTELCVQVCLWIQVYNESFRMWWLKANLGEGHWWEVDVLFCRLLSEIPSQNVLGLVQLNFICSQNSSPYPTHKRPVSLRQHWLFVSIWREGCVAWYFFNVVGLRTPPHLHSYFMVFYLHQAVPTEF